MSQEQFPQPEQPQQPIEHGQAESALNKDATAINEALRYVNEVAPSWVLEPTEVTVEQPANQDEILGTLDTMLGSQQDGEKLQQHLKSNLAMIRAKQAQPEHSGFGRLNIKAGYNLNDIRFEGDNLTKEEYETLRDDSWPEREIVDDPEQTNVMVTGLLHATGAEVLRSDVGEGGGIKKVYKGMLDGQPVYFEEMVLPRIRGEHDPNRETKTYLERTFNVVSEQTARHSLNTLSAEDADVLRSIGVEMPPLYSPEYNPDTYPNRSRMVETLQLYAAMNPVAETGQDAETIATKSELVANPLEELKQAQAERDKQEETVISNFRAHGATEEQIEKFQADITRMKEAELKRGRLFPHQAGFVRFEALSKPEQALDMGVGSGFEQGDWVTVQRSSGEAEHQWTFMGIDPTTGLAEVAAFDEETGDRLSKSYTLDELRKLNKRPKS
ncbi:MAG TPA: hypothetical protein VJR27_04565 [Candidatus Saccharimonadales bacterium]|nr:hypothetical protein [Candidatus Saccharimonadales bacterium]